MMTRLQMLIGILAEECTEIGKIASKAQRFGLENHHPDYEQTNREALHAELNDLNAVVSMLNADCGFGYTQDNVAMNRKINRVLRFETLSIELGQVEP